MCAQDALVQRCALSALQPLACSGERAAEILGCEGLAPVLAALRGK